MSAQRYLYVIAGEQNEVRQQTLSQLSSVADILWVGDLAGHTSAGQNIYCLPANKTRLVLGREFSFVVFDVWCGLDVNALAAVCGTIRGGGGLVLLTPALEEWPDFPDPDCRRFLPYPYLPGEVSGEFVRRFLGFLEGDDAVPSPTPHPQPLPLSNVFSKRLEQGGKGLKTAAITTPDQKLALQQILSLPAVAVLSADRGRGKSAVLGMAVKKLLSQGKRVTITAPSKATTEVVYRHTGDAGEALGFFAPDDLLATLPEADVLLVDEAATIPIPMLTKMLQHYPHCVFATTLHGYEGSGRGFVLRFQKLLDELVPGWLDLRLSQPIRWQEGDALEAWLNRVLIMDGEVSEKISIQVGADLPQKLEHHHIPQQQLAEDEKLLRQVFNLLINAHYQTRPSDLRQMLDAPNITTHVLRYEGQVVAVALLSEEGGLDEELTAAIHAGKRRPHGHLLPQSLTFHAGIEGAACLRCQRVMRIAVLPECQRLGIGQHFLAVLKEYARSTQADYLGVSYALTPGLQSFWEQAGFVSVRLGFKKDKASGARSLMQVFGLTQAGKELAQRAHQLFLGKN